jgi:preprotein translocase subunit YajC
MDWFISTAAAQTAAAAGAQSNPLLQMLPLLLIFVVFYFMLIRPQSKRAKEHRAMLATLEVGAEIATAGGIIGKVTEVGDNFVGVEIAANVLVKVQRNTISQILPKGTLKGS